MNILTRFFGQVIFGTESKNRMYLSPIDILKAEIEFLSKGDKESQIAKLLVYENAKNTLLSKIDSVLDNHISAIQNGNTLEAMLIKSGTEFLTLTDLEKIIPLRNVEFLEIECVNYLSNYYKVLLSSEVDSEKDYILPSHYQKYSVELDEVGRLRIGLVTIYGKQINAFDIGILEVFCKLLDTAIINFNQCKFNKEKDDMISFLDDLMEEHMESPVTIRDKMLKEIVKRLRAKEGYCVLVKEGRKPSLQNIVVDDLEIVNHYGENPLEESAESFVLEKALSVILAPDKSEIYDDIVGVAGYGIAAELNIRKAGKIGGALVIFDSVEFLQNRRNMIEHAVAKIDDFIIYNRNLLEEIKLKERVLNVLIPMVGEEQSHYILSENEPKNLAEPKPRFVMIMFSDLKGSTGAADWLMRKEKEFLKSNEQLESKKIELKSLTEKYINSINYYLGISSQAVLTFGGVVDKYIGDAVMAAWGVPLGKLAPKKIAICSLLACVYANNRTIQANKTMKDNGIEEVFIFSQRFVLHCGDVLAGIYGTPLRFDYTIMGAPVNEAARIEALNVARPGKIIFSEEFYSLISEWVEAYYEGEHKLKGKENLVKIYSFKHFKIPNILEFTKQFVDEKHLAMMPEDARYYHYFK
ncbi:MAG: adenylate/guanylate cyclase domain-containing protein [Leptospiraceae bacterium]|nr:adenylate/guanylate cyclase domain-containing protein [Leptospiraceae bacterium]